jgi:tRNA pseudouridine32 synthase/23S rRNA pseudouridine746 synthase
MRVIQLKRTIVPDDPATLCDVLALHSGLSKRSIKKAMTCGAVWKARPGAKLRRVRRATARVQSGDRVALYYDASILNQVPPKVRCVRDLQAYSIWFKPANLMTQGSHFGDHASLIRQVEHFFTPRRKAHPVHRLDRETSGLLLVAHTSTAAAQLSRLFAGRKIEKTYRAWILGDLRSKGAAGTIDRHLDNRRAVTRYEILTYDDRLNRSMVQVTLVTGRRHQIRRHFDAIGHPVIGDPRYGSGNKNESGLQLIACGLSFECPLGNGPVSVSINGTIANEK